MLSYDSPLPIKGQTSPAATALPPTFDKISNNGSVMPNSKPSHGRHFAHGHEENYHHIWLVTGPAGCGKSTVAEYLANVLDMPFVEGDSVGCPTPIF